MRLTRGFVAILRIALFLRLGLVLRNEEVKACHTTKIYIQNGTWLNTSRWLENGFFGNPEILPVPGSISPSKTTTPINPVAGNVAHIPNKDQDCICGAINMNQISDSMRGNENSQRSAELSSLSKSDDESQPKLAVHNEYIINPKEDPEEDQLFYMRTRLTKLLERAASINGSEPIYRSWLAKINITKNSESTWCTGVLLNARFVLTAAHCMCGSILVDCSTAQFPETPIIVTPEGDINSRSKKSPVSIIVSVGHVEGQPSSVASYHAHRVMIYEKFRQNGTEYGAGDVALIELNAENGIPRDSVIQPICLPPLESPQDGFHDVDCHAASSANPFRFIEISKDKPQIVCQPNGNASFITTFKRIPKFHPKLKCQTNAFGPEQGQNSPCNSTCQLDLTTMPQNNETCGVDAITDLFKNVSAVKYKVSRTVNGNTSTDECFFAQDDNPFSSYGWCSTCDNGGKCQTEKNWGFCSPECQRENENVDEEPNSEDDPMEVLEASVQSFEVFPDLECPVKEPAKNLEFCSRPPSLFNEAEVGEGTTAGSFAVKSVNPAKSSEVMCLGDAGAPLWKVHEFVNMFGRNQELAVLTGIISRPLGYCSSDGNVLVHTRIRQPGQNPEILRWILSNIKSGACRDIKSSPGYDVAKLF